MVYRQLGTSSLMVSRIGFGCMSLDPTSSVSETLIHKAIHHGINYFDTADLYNHGANESMLGRTLKNHRSSVIIATKAGNQWKEDGSGWIWNPKKEYILQCAEQSLERLQTDYIDLFQLHGGTMDDPVDETIEAFELLVRQGKIRYYGISSIRPNVIRYWSEHSNIVSVMMQYSILDRRPEEYCLPLLLEKGIGVLTRGTVAQGLLAGKPAQPYLGHPAEQVQQMAAVVQQVSLGRTMAQTSIQWTLQHPSVVAAVIGMHTEDQLSESASVFDVPPLSTAEYEQLCQVLSPLEYQDHR